LTPAKARTISGIDKIPFEPGVVFGCGAIGSKIVMHLARSGQTALTLLDPDGLSPHNLVRHALGAEYIGSNKAYALAESIKKMFMEEAADIFVWHYLLNEGIFENPETFIKFRYLLDCTASESFFNKIVMAHNINGPSVFSCSISDFGNLGIMYKEGLNRNPRLDDLQVVLHSKYNEDKHISSWLIREQQAFTNNNLTVQVGVGCNSETTVLSDEKVSAHSAFFAASIRQEITATNNNKGKIKLHRIIDSKEYSIETDFIYVEPFDVITAVNDPNWTVRFKNGILKEIKRKAAKSKKEAGGGFVGVANYKTMTIHVTDLIEAPSDSIENAASFYRGQQGLSNQIKKVTEGSGGQLGYIGEWHSHPFGPNGLSSVDMASVERFKEEFSKLTTPLPVFLTVIAPAGVLPFIY
jgi:integrative and conjugative element protein (TIGR02256 family)